MSVVRYFDTNDGIYSQNERPRRQTDAMPPGVPEGADVQMSPATEQTKSKSGC